MPAGVAAPAKPKLIARARASRVCFLVRSFQSGSGFLVEEIGVAPLECLDLAFRFVLGEPMAFLDAPEQLVALAGDHVQVVVGELAPLLLELSLDLFPIAIDTVLVHLNLHSWFARGTRQWAPKAWKNCMAARFRQR